MKNLFLVLVIISLASCLEKSVNKTVEGEGVEVELLFEKDGIKVYRFWDGGRVHYFTDRGETITTQNKYEENISEN